MEKITNKPIDSEKELSEFEEDLVPCGQPHKEEPKENINDKEEKK